jgi:MYXO-CTERM domain-containing protein
MPVLAIVLAAAASHVALPPAAVQATPDHPWRGFVAPPSGTEQPPRPPSTAAIYPHHTIFFNRAGGHYTEGGYPDSRSNINGIGTGTLPPFSCGDDAWHTIMQCLKKGFGRYDVVVTDVDPGTTPHTETVVAGSPEDIGLPSGGIAGIASMGCDQAFENGVSFAFSETSGCTQSGLLDMCWTAAQETAHLFGLDHEVACQDFMTYDSACGFNKSFTLTAAHCGEYANPPAGESDYGPHDCYCTGTTMQNSDQTLTAIFGARADGPPELVSMSPNDGDAVQVGFEIDAVVYDDRGFDGVEAFVDGTTLGLRSVSPFRWSAPAGVGTGSHTVKVVATDSAGHVVQKEVAVTLVGACSNTGDCPDGKVCDTGTGECKSGPGEPGGIGALCTDSTACDSGLCATGPDNEMRCIELCTTGDATSCPDTFDCLPAGAQGACWPHDNPENPSSGGGGGGCAVGQGSDSGLAGILGVLFFGTILLRRRRRQTS